MRDTNKTLSDFAKNALELKLPEGEELLILKKRWAMLSKIDKTRAKEDIALKEKRFKEDAKIQELRDEEDSKFGRPAFNYELKPMTTGHTISPEIYQDIMSKTYNKEYKSELNKKIVEGVRTQNCFKYYYDNDNYDICAVIRCYKDMDWSIQKLDSMLETTDFDNLENLENYLNSFYKVEEVNLETFLTEVFKVNKELERWGL